MNAKTNASISAIGQLIGSADSEYEAVLHEMAHAILLYGKICQDVSDFIEDDIGKMPTFRANDHEMRTVGLQLAVMRRFGFPPSWEADVIRFSWEGLTHSRRRRRFSDDKEVIYKRGSIKYEKLRAYARDVREHKPSKMLVDRCVSIIRAFERFS